MTIWVMSWRLIRLAALLYIVWITVLYVLQDYLVFPGLLMRRTGESAPRGVDVLTVDIGGGARVLAWLQRGEGCTAETPGPVVLFFHGNGEIIADNYYWMQIYNRMGISTLMVEYRGYGGAAGKPSERGLVADAVAFYDLAVARPEVDATRVVAHGRSLGGGIAAQLAARRPCAALILESTFTSLASMTWRYGAPPALVKHKFRTDEVLREYDGAVLVIHGDRDRIVPYSNGRALHRLAPGSTHLEIPGGHNDFPDDDFAYWQGVAEFLVANGIADADAVRGILGAKPMKPVPAAGR